MAEDNKQDKQEFASPENVKQNGYDIVFVIDNSKSIWKQQEERDQALRTIANLGVGSDVRIGSVYFADHVYKTFSLTSLKNEKNHANIVKRGLSFNKRDKKNIDTNIGNGLQAGLKLFEDQGTERKKIIILVSDGINENLAQQASYKRNANKKTNKYVKKIKKQGIDLYCVFIEKERAKKQYLKNLVASAAQTKIEADERFVVVKKSDMNQLSSTFSKVFYSLQGNMKYKEITMDSDGRYSFYIPNLNVYRLEIFLDNKRSGIKADLKREDGKKVKKTYKIDDGSIFFTVKNPQSGEWIIDVDGNDVNSTVGTIAYYAAIFANSSLEGEPYKGQSVKIKTSFADKKGKAISLDQGASVIADVTIKNKKGKIVQEEKNISMNIDGNIALSDAFELKAQGMLSCSLTITYQDFIHMSYHIIDKLAIDPVAPSAMDIAMQTFESVSITTKDDEDEKEQFIIDLRDYITDIDSDITKDMIFKEIQNLYEENPITVNLNQGDVIEKGMLTCVADKRDKVQFILTVADEMGFPVSVKVSGILKNQEQTRIRNILLAVGLLILCACILVYILHGKMLAKEYQAQRIMLKEQKDKMEANRTQLVQQATDDDYKNYMQVYSGLVKFIEHEQLDNEVQQILGIHEVLNSTDTKCLHENISSMRKQIDAICGTIDVTIQEYVHEPAKLARITLKTKLKKLIAYVKQLEIENKNISKKLVQINKDKKKLVTNVKYLKEFLLNLESIRKKTFLSVSCSMYAEVMGMGCRKSRNLDWFWKLDDFTVMSENQNLSEVINKTTGIIFFPCKAIEEDTDKSYSAVMVGASHVFDIWKKDSDEEPEQTNQAILLKSTEYYMDTKDIAGIIKLIVQ